MHLYNLTLQPATAIPQAIVGNFSGARQQEIIISHGTRLELVRPDPQTGKVATVIATDVFGSIRSLAAFRLTGGTKGEIAVRILCLPVLRFHLFRLRRSRLRLWTHCCAGL
jgi:splicing factor 3B subunit 3